MMRWLLLIGCVPTSCGVTLAWCEVHMFYAPLLLNVLSEQLDLNGTAKHSVKIVFSVLVERVETRQLD